MNRTDKENVLLQSLLAIAGVTLLAIGIVMVVSAWNGPAPQIEPEVHNVSTTTNPPANPETKPAEETAPPAESVAVGAGHGNDVLDDGECFPEEAEQSGEEIPESL